VGVLDIMAKKEKVEEEGIDKNQSSVGNE